MTTSKKLLIWAAIVFMIAALLVIAGGSVGFTIASLCFIGCGALWDRSLSWKELEDFEAKIESGEILTESAGDISEFTIDLDSLEDSDKEVLERVLNMKFDDKEEDQ